MYSSVSEDLYGKLMASGLVKETVGTATHDVATFDGVGGDSGATTAAGAFVDRMDGWNAVVEERRRNEASQEASPGDDGENHGDDGRGGGSGPIMGKGRGPEVIDAVVV
jgi:hypothetical protein